MSRFDELCQSSQLRYMALEDAKAEKIRFAKDLMTAWADYMESPPGRICFAEIGPDFKAGRVLGDVRNTYPPNLLNDDGYLRFAIVIELKKHEGIGKWMRIDPVFGIKKMPSGSFAVRDRKDETEIIVRHDDPQSLKSFCETFFAELSDYLKSPIGTPDRRFGFPMPMED